MHHQLLIAAIGFAAIFALLLLIGLVRHCSVFCGRHGLLHRALGLAELLWLLLGVLSVANPVLASRLDYQLWHIVYDVVLGLLGTMLTLSAASTFHHVHKNRASGALDEVHRIRVFLQIISHFLLLLCLFKSIDLGF